MSRRPRAAADLPDLDRIRALADPLRRREAADYAARLAAAEATVAARAQPADPARVARARAARTASAAIEAAAYAELADQAAAWSAQLAALPEGARAAAAFGTEAGGRELAADIDLLDLAAPATWDTATTATVLAGRITAVTRRLRLWREMCVYGLRAAGSTRAAAAATTGLTNSQVAVLCHRTRTRELPAGLDAAVLAPVLGLLAETLAPYEAKAAAKRDAIIAALAAADVRAACAGWDHAGLMSNLRAASLQDRAALAGQVSGKLREMLLADQQKQRMAGLALHEYHGWLWSAVGEVLNVSSERVNQARRTRPDHIPDFGGQPEVVARACQARTALIEPAPGEGILPAVREVRDQAVRDLKAAGWPRWEIAATAAMNPAHVSLIVGGRRRRAAA